MILSVKDCLRAPHKCLLALWAIGRCLSGESRMAPYRTVDAALGGLLRDFGPPRKSVHTEFPFWRLQGDGVWELDDVGGVRVTSSGDAYKGDLLSREVRGGLPADIYDTLRADHRLTAEIVRDLLAAHFPETRHDDILQAVGLQAVGSDPDFTSASRRRVRDPGFRHAVLRALRTEMRRLLVRRPPRQPNGGARRRPHQVAPAGGPNDIRNGIALCVLHHKLFDEGAFTLSPPNDGCVILVSESAHGTTGFEEWLGRFHRRAVRKPIRDGYRPNDRFVAWNVREVFQSPERP